MIDTPTLTTLDLYEIPYNDALLAKLHELQRSRCAEYAVTGGARPGKLRLSEPDPVRRVKAALDSWWRLTLDDGIGTRGHVLEDYLEVALFHSDYAPLSGRKYASQVPVQWHNDGRTAFDFVVDRVAGSERPVSCKSSIHDAAPSAANIAQEKSMMALAEYPPESVFEIWMVNVGTFRAVGPYEYTLHAEDIASAIEQLAGVSKAYAYFTPAAGQRAMDINGWNDASFWESEFGLKSTSSAFKYDRVDASGAIEKRVRAERRAAKALAAAKAEHQSLRDDIYKFVDEQIAAHAEAGETITGVTAWGADEKVIYGRKSNGAVNVTVKPFDAAETAA